MSFIIIFLLLGYSNEQQRKTREKFLCIFFDHFYLLFWYFVGFSCCCWWFFLQWYILCGSIVIADIIVGGNNDAVLRFRTNTHTEHKWKGHIDVVTCTRLNLTTIEMVIIQTIIFLFIFIRLHNNHAQSVNLTKTARLGCTLVWGARAQVNCIGFNKFLVGTDVFYNFM